MPCNLHANVRRVLSRNGLSASGGIVSNVTFLLEAEESVCTEANILDMSLQNTASSQISCSDLKVVVLFRNTQCFSTI